MAEGRDNYVYIAEADTEALTRAVRRLQILVLTSIPVILIGVGVGVVLRALNGNSPLLAGPLTDLLILLAIPVVAAYLVVPHCVKKTNITIGADFILAPTMTFPHSTVVVKYKDIARVRLDVLKDRIVGATIAAKGSVVVRTGRIKDPAVVVRVIFERASDKVKWHRARHPFGRMSPQEIRELIEKSQALSLTELLPPSVTLAPTEDLFPEKKGFLRHVDDKGTPTTWKALASEPPTPATHYVDFLILQMFRDGSTTRVLKRSEPLPTLTLEAGTAEPPPFEDLLSRLKTMCRLDLRADPGPLDGTIDVTIDNTPCRVLCRFDDGSDTCCQLCLERMTEQELREAAQER